MHENSVALLLNLDSSNDADMADFEVLEQKLEEDLRSQQVDLESLKEDFQKIGTPETLGKTVMNVVWEQFINQIGVVAGEDFIKENGGLTLDLRDSAHIQTTENFEKGKIATHNTEIDYKERYDRWQGKFLHDDAGNVLTHRTRSGEEVAILSREARKPFDQGRPAGSSERGTDMDHTISAAEIIRDPGANAHLTEKKQIDFANSSVNLNEMRSSHNRSKKDLPVKEWLDSPNSNGQKPKDIYADSLSPDHLDNELDQKYRQKDAEAREAYDRVKKEGESRSIKAGRKSQREEAFRIGKNALRAVLMGLLASLMKDVIGKLIGWIRSKNRKFSSFIESIKEALKTFFANIKQHLKKAGESFLTTILTAIYGPIIGALQKAWIFLKQGYQSVKQVIQFLKDPKNRNMPFSVKVMEVGKIVVVGVTAGGAIVLSEVIGKALMGIPVFTFQIPLLGSLANLLGLFLGALVSGLIGALALNLIDRMIAKKLRRTNRSMQMDKRNEILKTSDMLLEASYVGTQKKKTDVTQSIIHRHQEAGEKMNRIAQETSTRLHSLNQQDTDNKETLKSIDELLNQI